MIMGLQFSPKVSRVPATEESMKRLCCILALVAGSLTALHAQGAAASNPYTTEAQGAWNRTMHNVLAGAEQMPEDKWGYKPTPESMSFRDIIAHVADSAMGACSALNGARKNAGAAQMKTKDELIGALKAAQAECDKAYAPDDAKAAEMVSAGPGGKRTRLSSLWGNTVHIEHEYAQMTVHLRINGFVPPSTAERMPAAPAK
jgi:DinB superfamily